MIEVAVELMVNGFNPWGMHIKIVGKNLQISLYPTYFCTAIRRFVQLFRETGAMDRKKR